MTYGINRCRFIIGHAGVSVFVTLQKKSDIFFLHEIVKKPALHEIPLASRGMKRMMRNDDFPFRLRLPQLFLQPRLLREKVEKFAVAVKQEELHVAVNEREKLIFAHHRVEKIGMDE